MFTREGLKKIDELLCEHLADDEQRADFVKLCGSYISVHEAKI